MPERWLPVVGYEGYYEVSDHGRVRSVLRTVTRTDGRKVTYKGMNLQPVRDGQGRCRVSLHKGNKGKRFLVPHLVAAAFLGARPKGMDVCHGDGDPSNNRADNLRYDSKRGNMLDKRGHGTDHNVNKTHCPRGHELVDPNLVPSRKRHGRRDCLACSRTHGRVGRRPDLAPHFKELSDHYYSALR